MTGLVRTAMVTGLHGTGWLGQAYSLPMTATPHGPTLGTSFRMDVGDS